MEQDDTVQFAEPRQRRLELQRFLHRLVDEVLDDLLPEAESLFESGYNDMILNEYHEALLQLGESARKTFAEFKCAIQSYTSSNAVARGEVHPLTKYVVNYI